MLKQNGEQDLRNFTENTFQESVVKMKNCNKKTRPHQTTGLTLLILHVVGFF